MREVKMMADGLDALLLRGRCVFTRFPALTDKTGYRTAVCISLQWFIQQMEKLWHR